MFVSKDQARNLDHLAMQMSRQSHRGTTLGFAQKSLSRIQEIPFKETINEHHHTNEFENEG